MCVCGDGRMCVCGGDGGRHGSVLTKYLENQGSGLFAM